MPDIRKFRSLVKNWEVLGDTDPLFGVLSDPTRHGGKWDPESFFASGQAHVEKLLRILADTRASFQPGTCLDFGCGPGRLTIPLSESFRHTVGVDVARPMIRAARRFAPTAARCEFVVNRTPDLRQFRDASFDVVHSCLVLQHIPPDIAVRYIAEFFRVSRPGGLGVFQRPAATRTDAEISASHALPVPAFAAQIAIIDPPARLEASAFATLTVRVTNLSDVTWPADIPAGRHICLGNHWLRPDLTVAIFDDGRAYLPDAVPPGGVVDLALDVQAPDTSGEYLLDVDLVQEHVSWFAQQGSRTGRSAVVVSGTSAPAAPSPPMAVSPPAERRPDGLPARPPLLRRLVRRLRGGAPTFEMHVVPRAQVEEAIRTSGGVLLKAVDDNAAGPSWLSYTYICRVGSAGGHVAGPS
jgi:SAM-dependent methyltransferase